MAKRKREKKSPKDNCRTSLKRTLIVLEWVATIACTILLIMVLYDSVNNYLKFQTGNSIQQRTVDNLPFPAISICISYFEWARAYKDFKLPVGITFRLPPAAFQDPLQFYEKLSRIGVDIQPNLWKYYFTLDKVLKLGDYESKDPFLPESCYIGGISCKYKLPDNLNFSKLRDHDVIEVNVTGGTWTTRFLADSDAAANFMCHTLVPNVTVDFERQFGNSIRLKWAENFAKTVPSWMVYFHDKNEQVLLNTYAMESLPYVMYLKRSTNNSELSAEETARVKKKARIQAKLFTQENSEHHSCNEDPGYSRNLCDLMWCWDQRLELVRSKHGDRFDCILPGVVSGNENKLPICTEFSDNKDVLESLSLPPIGVYKKTSPCLKRCQTYKYSLSEETVSSNDKFMMDGDMVIYFPSSEVDIWFEYELQNFFKLLSDAGGAIGLFLGWSVLSMFTIILELFRQLERRFFEN